MQWEVWNVYFLRYCAYHMAVAMETGKIFESVEQEEDFFRDEEDKVAFLEFEETFLLTLTMYAVIKHLEFNENTEILFGLEDPVNKHLFQNNMSSRNRSSSRYNYGIKSFSRNHPSFGNK